MTDAELNKAAIAKRYASNGAKKAFRDGYTAKCNGRKRDAKHLRGINAMAWQDGYDFKPPASRNGKAADVVTMEYKLSIEFNGGAWDVTQQDFRSGKFALRVDAYPELRIEGDEDTDQDRALERLREKLVAHLGIVDARTVDGERAKVDTTPKPAPSQLPLRSSIECASEVRRCEMQLAEREAEENEAKSARKGAEHALSIAHAALTDAVEREAREAEASRQLPLVPA